MMNNKIIIKFEQEIKNLLFSTGSDFAEYNRRKREIFERYTS